MAKYLKKKRRKLKFTTKCVFLFTFALLSWLFTSICVGSINTSLTIDIQKMNAEIDNYKAENQQLNIEIQSLQNKDRIYTIASEAGLEQNQDNVVSINQGEVVEKE